MPTAQSFTALTAGEAIPFCWVTVTPAAGEDWYSASTLDDAIRSFWLSYSLRVQWSWSATYTGSNPSQDPTEVSCTYDVTGYTPGPLVGDSMEPRDRVCLELSPAFRGETAAGQPNAFQFLDFDFEHRIVSGAYSVLFEFNATAPSAEVTSLFLRLTNYELPADQYDLLTTYTVTNMGTWLPNKDLTLYAYAPVGFDADWDITLGTVTLTPTNWSF